MPRGSVSVICVLAWTGSVGATALTSVTSPRSCTITASTPAAAMARTNRSASGNSSLKTRVFRATNPRTLRAWRNPTTAGNSSSVKLAARARALNADSPK